MKLQRFFILIFVLTLGFNSYAQRNKELEKEIIERKVDTTFTVEETTENFLLFHNNMKLMKMDEELENKYANIVLNTAARMRRLDDKDKNYTNDERRVLFEGMLANLNNELKEILSEEQFALHQKNFNVILERFYKKAHWNRRQD